MAPRLQPLLGKTNITSSSSASHRKIATIESLVGWYVEFCDHFVIFQRPFVSSTPTSFHLCSMLVGLLFWHAIHYLQVRRDQCFNSTVEKSIKLCAISSTATVTASSFFIFLHLSSSLPTLQDHVSNNPLVMGVYPFMGVAFIISALPFLMYLSFPSDFTRVHPLSPGGYFFLLKRLSGAVQNSSNMKVSSKEL